MIKKLFLLVELTLFSNVSFSLTFSVVPDRPLPTSVPQYGSTSAYYLVVNTTNSSLNNNFVTSLPANVTQTTCQPNFCGATFNLGPQGSATESCVLKLNVKGPVDSNDSHPLRVCTEDESSCDGTNAPLTVTEGEPSPLIGIGAGSYSDSTGRFFPLVVTTNNNGNEWNYPKGILDNLNVAISPSFFSGELRAATCSGSLDKSVCISPRYFCTDASCTSQLPLIAVGTHNTDTWFYPASVFQDLQSRIDPNFKYGVLNDASCVGSGHNAFCIAPGDYYNPSTQFPLLALSSDGGQNWSYPPAIYTKLKTLVDPQFKQGFFNSTACTDRGNHALCIAAGEYCNDKFCTHIFPLLALTSDGGKTWSYPPSVHTDLTTKIDPNFLRGFFTGVSCTGINANIGTEGNSFCIASGLYSTDTASFPLIAYSTDNGITWFYPTSVFQNLTATINPNFVLGTSINPQHLVEENSNLHLIGVVCNKSMSFGIKKSLIFL